VTTVTVSSWHKLQHGFTNELYPMVLPLPPQSVSNGSKVAGRAGTALHSTPRVYRLVDHRGDPHPVLDDLYDSLEAAWAEAQSWWHSESGPSAPPVGIGVEVSTGSGVWRTLRHPES
jgi:hypothetical protein